MLARKNRLPPKEYEAEQARIAERARVIQRETDEIRLSALNYVLQKLRDEDLINSETSETQDYLLGLAQAQKRQPKVCPECWIEHAGLCW
jgi:hypothetical protein